MIFDKEPPVVCCEKCASPLQVNPKVEGPYWSCVNCGWCEASDLAPSSKPIPRDLEMDDASYQTRDVFAHYGTAVFTANVLEHELIVFLTLLQNKAERYPTQQSWDHHYLENTKLTMGQLAQRVGQYLNLGNELKVELGEAVKMRNDLAHYYFRERAVHLVTFASREFMIEEMKSAVVAFNRVDALLVAERRKLISY